MNEETEKSNSAIPIDNIGETDRQYEEGLPDKKDEAIKALQLCKPYIEEMQSENNHEPNVGIFYDRNLEWAFKAMNAVLSSPPEPASKDEGIEGLAEKLYPTKTDLSDPNRELHGSMNREYKRCFIEGFKAASKEQEGKRSNTCEYCRNLPDGMCNGWCYEKEVGEGYWKKRCEAAENYLSSYYDVYSNSDKYIKWQELKTRNHEGKIL